ncbi:MAG TPA: glucose-1-phosphate adenylyltransferase subunit GlgD [Firmicutes bacterium]|nr:glucose-1-phosphate adenylyltransferase subunit GlgD [Bacillota bacterium]
MKKIMGLCNLHAPVTLNELTHARPIASTSFLGRYAFIDFPLSNFSNSGIDEVGILVRNQPRSILKHLGSTNVWNTNTKLGYEAIMYNEKFAHTQQYNHDINNIIANDWIFFDVKPDLFVIAPAHIIYPLDFNKMIAAHEATGADITILYAAINDGKVNFVEGDQLSISSEDHIDGMNINKGTKDQIFVSMETYVLDMLRLQRLLDIAKATSAFYSLRDIIAYVINHDWKVIGYRHEGYVRHFSSMKQYRDHSLELLNYDIRKQLFLEDWPIFTVTHDTPPSKYGLQAQVKNSFIANGSRINGKVNNSIISRNVVIEEGAVVKNSIIFTDTKIGKNVRVNNAVIDKHVQIREVKDISGTEHDPLYVKQGDRI